MMVQREKVEHCHRGKGVLKRSAAASERADVLGLAEVEHMQLTQFAIDRVSDAAFWMGADARFVYVNHAACISLGYSRKELLSLTVPDIDPRFTRDTWPGHWKMLKRKGSFVVQSMHKRKDGTLFPVEITVNYVRFGGNEYNCAFVRDISERQRTEAMVQLARKEWEATFDAMHDWVCLIDLDSRILRTNRAGKAIVGLDVTQIVDRLCCKVLHGADRPIEGCPLPAMIESGQRESIELQMADGRWMMISVDPVFDDRQIPVSAVHIVRDITVRKRYEIERERLFAELKAAHEKVKTLSGLLPICSLCKKIRDDKGYWNQIESYICRHSEADFSHSICPECARRYYPDLDIFE